MYILHCHEKNKLKRKVETEEFGDAVQAAEECKSATHFDLFSSDWSNHHMSGEVRANGYIDWVRTKY